MVLPQKYINQGKEKIKNPSKSYKAVKLTGSALLKSASFLHHKTTQPLHHHLLNRFQPYANWWQWKFHKHVHLIASLVVFLILAATVTTHLHGAFALSDWVQSDWSGGVGSSTTNQYSSSSNANTATADQVSLSSSSNSVSNNSFSSGLSGWVTGLQPDSISGLKMWLKADSITGLSNGSAVSTWSDSSGNGSNATQSTSGDQATYVTNVIGGEPALQFNGTSDQYSINLPSSVSDNSNTLFAVHEPSSQTKYGMLLSSDTANDDEYMDMGYPSAGKIGAYYAGVGEVGGSYSYTAGAPIISTLVSGSSGTAYDDGTAQTPTSTTSTSSSSLVLGNWKVPGYYYQGDVSEVIMYNTALSSSQRAAVENYLASKYGIAVSSGVTATQNTTTTYNGAADSAKLVSNDQGEFTQNINVGNTNTYTLSAYAYDGGSTVSSLDLQLYANGNAISTNYTSVGGGWYLLSGTVTGVNSSVAYGVQVAASQTVYLDGFSLTEYSTSGSLLSNIYNTGVEENYATLTYSATIPSGTTVSVWVRSGNQSNLSDASAWSSSCAIVSGGTISNSSCDPNGTQYVQYELQFTSTGSATPTFNSITISYSPTDTTPPSTNATNLQLFDGNGGTQVSANNWANTAPYVTWTAATDHEGGSGIAGYCLYLGQSSTGNPETSSGDLGGSSPLNTGNTCPFAVSATNVDTSISGYLATALTPSTSPYYLSIAAITGANVMWNWTNSPTQFKFYFDNSQPTNPAYISAPSEFVSNTTVNLTWPTTGSDAASDAYSGVAGLQYKIGSSGTWYGTDHSGTQDCTDLLPNSGSYTTTGPDLSNLQQGDNIVYFRTWSTACTVSSAYVTTVIKINSTAPSSPQNLTPTPATNTTNSFAFSWLAPATFQGSANNITYCYTVNALPTDSNCTYTGAGVTSLDAGAFATEPGANTVYVVAKDEAGNVNYATYASTTFTANTPAPGIPLNLDIADVSIKASSSWKLALSWDQPSQVGSGIATYKIYRSSDGVNFSPVASTAGTSYVDSGLSQQTYYYKVDACDSANNCGSFTSVVNLLPTGKFTSPANLLVGPNVTSGTQTATITWTTDRDSSSSVEYGLSSNHYLPTAAANTDQVVSHDITVDNLQAGTTYYYRAQWTDADGNVGTSSEYTLTTLPAPTVSNVTVTDVNLHNATINFTTKGAIQARLYYGPDGSFAQIQSINTSTSTSTYSVPISNLNDGTTYAFRVDPFDQEGNEYEQTIFSFTTPPAPVISNVAFEPIPGALTGTEQVSWTTNVPASSQISYEAQGASASSATQAIDTALTTTHSMNISNLTYNSPYTLVATSEDALGNVANSDQQLFKTGLDTRPPIVSDVTIQPSIKGTGVDAQGQIIVSWKTDKPSSSQVAYGQGTGGSYSAKTAQDTTLVVNHVVVISDLPPSHVYHLQVLSVDNAGNVGKSSDQTTIIGQPTDSVIDIILNALQGIFGGL